MSPYATPEELRAAFGSRWAICRNTEKNRARYGRCVTPKQYKQAERKALAQRSAT